MKKNILVAGIDLGHSAVKSQYTTIRNAGHRHQFLIPTVVCDAFHITNEEAARKAAAETVELSGKSYFFGNTARTQTQNQNYSGIESNWITEGPVHDVLLLGSVKKILEHYAQSGQPLIDQVILILGLPTQYFESQAADLKERAYKLVKSMLIEGTELKIGIKAQSEAPIYPLAYDVFGNVNASHDLSKESYGIVEVGHFTIDFSLFIDGQMVTSQGGSIPQGVYTVYDKVREEFLKKKLPTQIQVLENAVQKGIITIRGDEVNVKQVVKAASDQIASVAAAEMRRLFGERIDLVDNILVTGGGAELVAPYFAEQYKHTKQLENPRWGVAEGLIRVGLYHAHKEAK